MCLLSFPSREGQSGLVLENVSTGSQLLTLPRPHPHIHTHTASPSGGLGESNLPLERWATRPFLPLRAIRAGASHPPQSRTALEPLARSLGGGGGSVGWGSGLWLTFSFKNCGYHPFLWSPLMHHPSKTQLVTSYFSLLRISHSCQEELGFSLWTS